VSVYTKKIQVTGGKYSMVLHERALHNCLIPRHRKYRGEHNLCDIRAVHDGNVG